MSISVTILKDKVYDEYGRPLTVGSVYALPDELARSMVSGGLASFVTSGIAKYSESQEEFGGESPVVVLPAANIASPTAGQLRNTLATYQLNVPPYSRYSSNGTSLALQYRAGDPPNIEQLSALRAGKPWLRAPLNTTSFTFGGSATGAATVRNGRRCIEITSPGNASVQNMCFPITNGTVTEYQHIVFEVEDASEWNGGNWRLGFFSGAVGTLTNGVRFVQTVGTQNGWNGVHCMAPLTTEWVLVGTGDFSTTMTQCAIQFVRKAAASVTTKLWIYEVAEGERNTLPNIVIGADDGHLTWYNEGLPVLEKYGFSSYLAFIADQRSTATRMSAAQWNDAVLVRGHHAVVHGANTGISTLRDYFASHPGFATAKEAMIADIAHNRDAMIDEGLDPDGRGRTFYVYPGGFHQPSGGAGDNTIRDALIACGMTAGRRAVVENAIIADGGWSGSALYLPIIGHNWSSVDEAANVAAVILQMQTEIAAGRSVVLMFHEVRAVPSIVQQITAANLELIVAAAAVLVRAGSARSSKMTDLQDQILSYTSPVQIGQR